MKEQEKFRPRNYEGKKASLEVRKRNVECVIAKLDLMPSTKERLLRPFDREFIRYKKKCV